VGGACAIAVGDGGQTLHVRAEKFTERVQFRLAQLRELFGNVRDRAVVLANLHPRAHPAGTRGEPCLTQRAGDLFGLGHGRLAIFRRGRFGRHRPGNGRSAFRLRATQRFDPVDHIACPLPCEFRNRLVTADLTELAYGCPCQIVIGMTEAPSTYRGELVLLGGAPTSLLLPWRRTGGPSLSGIDERVQMSAHSRRRQSESRTDGCRGNRSFFQQQTYNRRPSATFDPAHRGRSDRPGAGLATGPFVSIWHTHAFHNISVAEFLPKI